MADFQRYADLTIGDSYPREPQPFVVTAAIVDAFRVATVGDEATPLSDAAIAPPMLAGAYTRAAIAALKGPPGGVHAKQRFRFIAPVRIGDRLTTVLTIREKYTKNERNYVVSTLATTRADGTLVTEGRVTAVWGRES